MDGAQTAGCAKRSDLFVAASASHLYSLATDDLCGIGAELKLFLSFFFFFFGGVSG